MSGDIGHALVAARMAFEVASHQLEMLMRASSARLVILPDGRMGSTPHYSPELQPLVDRAQKIVAHYGAGCAALASPDPSALRIAEGHFREACHAAGVVGMSPPES